MSTSPITTIHSVRLFDGHTVHPSATVSFDASTGLITSVSTSDSATSSSDKVENANIIDGSGHTLLPGLIESHMHCYAIHLVPEFVEKGHNLNAALKCGVTTVCDMHSDLDSVNTWRQKISAENQSKQSKPTLPDLKSSLLGATIEGGWPKPIVLGHDPTPSAIEMVSKWPNLTPETAGEYVASHKSKGADYIKLMQEDGCSLALPIEIPTATLELQTAVVRAAHDQGMICVGHALSLENTKLLLDAGVDGLTHTFVDQPVTDELIDLYQEKKAFVIPTLVVLASLTGEEQGLREKFAEVAGKRGVIGDFEKENMMSLFGMKKENCRLDYAYETVRKLHEVGVDVVAGTDSVAGLKGTAIGPSLWQELYMYVDRCGFSATEALGAATGLCAQRFKFEDRGVVQEGKRSDLVLVKGDVTDSIERLWEEDGIVGVWKEGRRAV